MARRCLGTGASGQNMYGFDLELYDVIDTENCRMTLSAKEVEFRLLKKEAKEWPRLQSAKVRPSWLRVDFDRWKSDSSGEEEEDEKSKKSVREEHQKRQLEAIEQELKKFDTYMKCLFPLGEVGIGEAILTHFLIGADVARKAYLVCYNVVQWVGFCVVVWLLGKCLFDGYVVAIIVQDLCGKTSVARPLWQDLCGKTSVARPLWQDLCGKTSVARPLWQDQDLCGKKDLCGKTSVARPLWQDLCGKTCVARPLWQDLCGKTSVARPLWQDLCGKTSVARPLWQDLCGKTSVARPLWQDLCGKTSVARPLWQDLCGKTSVARPLWQDLCGKTSVARPLWQDLCVSTRMHASSCVWAVLYLN
eukprot:Em0009g1134a